MMLSGEVDDIATGGNFQMSTATSLGNHGRGEPGLDTRDSTKREPAAARHADHRLWVGQTGWRAGLDVVAALAMLVVAGVSIWRWYHQPPEPPPEIQIPREPISLDGIPLLGVPSARAGFLIFSDFQCPYCAVFVKETMPTLREVYVDKALARVGFRHLPLPFHSRAVRAAESAECAGQQGQFWPMHDALFRKPSRFEEADFSSHAVAIGLDSATFRTCMQQPPSDRIRRDMELAQGIGFAGTPAFVVGRIENGALHATSVLVGTYPIDVFHKALEGALGR